MAGGLPPFMNSTGLISKIFDKIAEAQSPDRFTQDFLGSVLGFTGGSAKPIIPLMKRLGFLKTDGTPTDLYARFRNPSERSSAMLEALKAGYPTIYSRSEFAHALAREKLRDLIVQVTGLEAGNPSISALTGTFEALKKVGNVDASTTAKAGGAAQPSEPPPAGAQIQRAGFELHPRGQAVGMNLSYTINLNLPSSSDPNVFNAIFRALKEHLLGN